MQIGEVKSQIEQARGPAFPKDGMTLIFNGKARLLTALPSAHLPPPPQCHSPSSYPTGRRPCD